MPVYVIHSKRSRAVKIGFTKASDWKRAEQIRTEMVGEGVLVLKLASATLSDERLLHRMFRPCLVSKGGREWFEEHPVLGVLTEASEGKDVVTATSTFMRKTERLFFDGKMAAATIGALAGGSTWWFALAVDVLAEHGGRGDFRKASALLSHAEDRNLTAIERAVIALRICRDNEAIPFGMKEAIRTLALLPDHIIAQAREESDPLEASDMRLLKQQYHGAEEWVDSCRKLEKQRDELGKVLRKASEVAMRLYNTERISEVRRSFGVSEHRFTPYDAAHDLISVAQQICELERIHPQRDEYVFKNIDERCQGVIEHIEDSGNEHALAPLRVAL